MMKQMLKFICLAALMLLLLAACNPEPITPADGSGENTSGTELEITGVKWSLLYIGKSSLLPGTEITLTFEDGQVSGSACNSYGGDYELDGSTIRFGMLFQTEMACMEPEGVMDQESRYMQFLAEVVEVELAGGQLILTKADGDSLTFEPWQEPEPVSLDKTIWTLLYIGKATQEGEAVGFTEYAVLEDSYTSIEFEGGNIFGKAGCNNYNAEASFDGWNLSFSPIGSTKMYCEQPEGLMDQEATFLEILGGIERYGFDSEGNLVLTGLNGARLTFAPHVQPEPIELEGSAWNLVELNGEALLADTEITAAFAEDTITGNSGCCQYAGAYIYQGIKMQISDAAVSTFTFCPEPEGVMEQEEAYLAALMEVIVFRIEDGQLILGTPDADLLIFEPVSE